MDSPPPPRSSREGRARLAAWLVGGAIGSAALVAAPNAGACGGYFAPQGSPAAVSGHRMVMSVSPAQSVLWDQIQYSGEPEEFAWVLPVKPGARIETSRAAFFEALEATTAVRVTAPMLDCDSSDGGIGCSSQLSLGELDAEGDATLGGENGRSVDVVHQGTVGPYESVTLSTETPGALNTWLGDHGYQVDPSSQPIIDAYVAEGFDFIALRLLPGKGVQEMTPVRVVSPGSSVTLPLRMVAIGAGDETPIVLYVVGEGRYKIETFTEVAITRGLLSWDFADLSTNYETMRRRALAANDKRSFVTTFAGEGALSPSLFTTYADQAVANGESEACSAPFPFGEQGIVRNPCPPEEPWDSPACEAVTDGLDARRFGCEDLDDLSVAFEGLHLEDVWLTRMEMILPKAALATDMTVAAAPAQAPVANEIEAAIAVNADGACPAGTIPRVGPAARERPRTGGRDLVLLGCAALAAMLARRAGQRFARAAERKNA